MGRKRILKKERYCPNTIIRGQKSFGCLKQPREKFLFPNPCFLREYNGCQYGKRRNSNPESPDNQTKTD